MAICPQLTLVKLDNVACISIVWKPWGVTRSQPPLPDGLAYPKDTLKPYTSVRVANKVILPALFQTRVTARTAWVATAALLPYTQLHDKKSIVATNGVV